MNTCCRAVVWLVAGYALLRGSKARANATVTGALGGGSYRGVVAAQGAFLTIALLLLLTFTGARTVSGAPADRTWGGGGANDNWTTAANWNTVPVAGDGVIFAGSTRLINTNNFAANTAFRLISFIPGAGAFELKGNAINLNGNMDNSGTSATTQTISLNMALQKNAQINANSVSAVWINGLISGAYTLTINNGATDLGTVTLAGNNSFTGLTTLKSGGVLNIRHGSALGTTDAGTVVTNGALELQGGIAVGAETLSLIGTGISSGGALRSISGDNSWAGAITLTGASRINSDSGMLTIDVASGNAIGGATFGLTVGGAGNVTITDPIATTTGTLTKDGAGTLTLSGANTFSGATTIGAGTLAIDGAGKLGNGAYAANIANNGALIYASSAAQTFSGILSGSGTLTKTNTSTLTLSGVNTYTNTTTISAGTLAIGGAGRLGSGSYTANIANNGLLNYASTATQILSGVSSGSGALAITNGGMLILAGNNTFSGGISNFAGTLQIGNGGTSGTLGSGDVKNQESPQGHFLSVIFNRTDPVGSPFLVTNAITAMGISDTSYLKVYTGAVQLGGTNDNAHTIGIVSNGATLILAKTPSRTSDTVPVHALGQMSFVLPGGTLQLAGTGGDQIADIRSLTVSSGGVFDLNGRSETMAALTNAGTGIGSVGSVINSSPASTSTLTITSGIVLTNHSSMGGVGNLVLDGVISGINLALTKVGNGILTLNRANTYNSNTLISAGTLALGSGGSLHAESSVSIAAGGTFDVSAKATPYTWGSSAALTASGSGIGATAAVIKGPVGRTVNLGSRPITLTYDGANPALFISQGTLALNANTVTVNGTELPVGAYPIIHQASGTVSTSGTFTVNGTTIVSPKTGSILVDGGDVYLLISGTAKNTTWDGGGTNDNWRTALDWVDNIGPGPGDTLSFAGTTRLTPSNDFPAGVSFPSIYFSSGAGEFTVGGKAITMNGTLESASANKQTLALPIFLNTGSSLIIRPLAGTGDLTISGTISGSGDIHKQVYANLITKTLLSGSNTYSGKTTIWSGILSINSIKNIGSTSPSSLGQPAVGNGTISMGSGAELWPTLIYTGNGDITDRMIDLVAENVVISQEGSGLLKFTGAFTASRDTSHILRLNGLGAGEINGVIANPATLTTRIIKDGSGAWTLSGNNTYSGSTVVNSGTLIVSGTSVNSAAIVQSGATIKGAGAVGALSVNPGGTVAPGNSDILRGGLTVGSLDLKSGALFRVKIGDVGVGDAECNRTDRDYIVNQGAFSMAGSTTIQLDSSQTDHWITTTDHVWSVISGGITSTNGFALDASTDWTNELGGGSLVLEARSGNLQVVYDDDIVSPVTDHVNLPGAAAAPFVVAASGTALANDIRGIIPRRTGIGTNVVNAVTDAELASAGDLGLQFVIGAHDVQSGVARGTTGDTNTVMSISFGNVVVGNFANYNACWSTVQTTTNQILTNVWTFANGDFTGATITSLMSQNQSVRMTVPDTDNDRPNDRATLSGQQVGYLRVADDDVKGPLISEVTVAGVFDEATYFESFEEATGWSGSETRSGEWIYESSLGTYIASGSVLWGALEPKVTGTHRIGLLTNVAQTITTLQLPSVENPGMLTAMAGRFGEEGAGNDVQIRVDWLNGVTWTNLGTRSVTNRNLEYEMFTWNIEQTGVVTLRLVRVSTTGPEVYVDDLNVTPISEWIRTNQLNISWSEGIDDYSALDEYRIVVPATNSSPPIATSAGLHRDSSVTNDTFDLLGHQGVLTGYVFAIDNDNDRTADRAMGNAKPMVVKVDNTPPTMVYMGLGGTNASTATVDDPTTQFDLSWSTENVGPDDPEHPNHPTGLPEDRYLLSPWRTYKIYYGTYNPLEIPPDDNPTSETTGYIYTNFLATRAYTNWQSVTADSPIIDPSAASYQPNYHALTNIGQDQIRLYDLDFDQDYLAVVVGVDQAGNEGLAGLSSWATNNTIKFAITRGWNISKQQAYSEFPTAPSLTNTAAPYASALAWTVGKTNLPVTRDYDLISWDSGRFVESSNNQWKLVGTVRTNWFVDDGGQFRGRGEIRFYRASYEDRWKTTRLQGTNIVPQRPLASEEIYALHNVILSPGQNFVSLHGIPYTNTFYGVFGGTEIFPGGSTLSPAGGATTVEFYATGTNAPTSEQFFLDSSGSWHRVGGGDVTHSNLPPDFFSRGFSINLPPASHSVWSNYQTTYAFDYGQVDSSGNPVQVPAMIWSPILQVPTNNIGFSRRISTGRRTGRTSTYVYNLVALQLPVSAHPSEMQLIESGFVKGLPNLSDQIYTMNTATKSVLSGSTIYCDANGVWRFLTGNGLVPGGYFKPNDVLVLVSRNQAEAGKENPSNSGDWTWSYHPTNYYQLPTRWMGN